MPALLRVDGIEVAYGQVPAVRGASLEVRPGEIVALIGSNGAGKTTTLRAISGLLPIRRGLIEFEGDRLDGLSSSKVVGRGIAHVPEGRQLFPTMTVLENLELGAGAAKALKAESLEWVFELFPRLRERRRQLAGTLSGGEQQMVAIGRGLMARPKLLMLDEPSLGLAPVVVRAIFDNLVEINRRGMAILLVEQNVLRALQLSHRGYVLENGQIVLDGPRDTLLADGHIKQAYLGR
ncbi:MAG: Fe(3+)-transporting ATPase, branched-chain amino acid transport system ATP-binding protein [Candidatus Rokubacteria bacterium CSP1-6]|nr:MAG: Fe(3+)-transporting ATPase, branched-chain amino acid transport system ATP-binding protein [Candidatus Rokubacteria bacterium CSP1-6]